MYAVGGLNFLEHQEIQARIYGRKMIIRLSNIVVEQSSFLPHYTHRESDKKEKMLRRELQSGLVGDKTISLVLVEP